MGDQQRGREGYHCPKHVKRHLEFYCLRCDQMICINCKLTEHEMHETKDLMRAAKQARSQLSEERQRVKRQVNTIGKTVSVSEREWQEVMDKKAALKEIIVNRHATLQTAIDRFRDEALASLDIVTDDILAMQELAMVSQQELLHDLNKLQQRLKQALDGGSGLDVLAVAGKVKRGLGSEDAMQKLTTKQMTTVCRPVLRFSGTPDAALQLLRDYMGSAAKMEMTVSAPEVSVVEQFRCREDPDTDVYHLCPMTDNTIYVSYEPYMLRINAASEKFSAAGEVIRTRKFFNRVRISRARGKSGANVFKESDKTAIHTYAKKTGDWQISFLRLDYIVERGVAVVVKEEIISEDQRTKATDHFTIHCAPHRAFDVDASEQLFVVLEDGKAPDFQRRVQLFLHSQPEAIATYKPVMTPFQPSDVCFYTLGGKEVLLVADELNDAIHVVKIQDGRLSFVCHLAPGCPLLVQPTALNTDTRGRLWVACRGGRILVCTPCV